MNTISATGGCRVHATLAGALADPFLKIPEARISGRNVAVLAHQPSDRQPYGVTERAELSTLQRLTGHTITWLARFFSGFTVRWIDCQPDTCQRVYFANHTSHLDAVVLWSALPRELRKLTRPVAAQDYWGKTRWRRFLASSFNALLIDRKEIKVHQSPVESMLREIGTVYSLIVFPEGSRAEDDEMGQFKSGLYYLAKKRPDLELVPVYMDNMNRILPRGEVLPVPLLSSITIGPPIWLEAGEQKSDFLARARESVRALKDR